MIPLFWFLVAFVALALVGFPLMISILGATMRRGYRTDDITPSVTILIAAYNESDGIVAKVRNGLAQRYPAEQLDVLVVDDGSTDDTADAVKSLADPRVRVEVSPGREGKVGALNRGMRLVTSDIVLFTDANAQFEPDAVARLVRPFADPTIGGVCGNQLTRSAAGALGEGERWYWEYDKFLKKVESGTGSIVAADGSIFAVRREFVDPIPAGVTDDFFVSTGVIAHGARLVFVDDARSIEDTLEEGGHHFDRRVRITQQALQSLAARRALLNPWRTGLYAFVLFGHKVLRRLAAPAVLALAPVSVGTWSGGPGYQLVAVVLVGWWVGAGAGWLLRAHVPHKVLAAPAYVLLGALATTVGLVRFALGHRRLTWEPVR